MTTIKPPDQKITSKPGVEPEAFVAASEAPGNGDGRLQLAYVEHTKDPRKLAQWPQTAVIFLGLYALVGGITSLAGWAADIPRFTDWFRNGISIQPNAAIAVASAGAAILFLRFGYARTSIILGAFVGFIGLTSLFQIAADIDLGFNSLLMFDREWGRVGVIIPGRMGTPGAVSWTLIGTAIVFLSVSTVISRKETSRQLRAGAVTLSLIALGVSSLSLIGYFYGAEILYTLPKLTVIALQTATFVFAVSLAILMGVTDVGPMRLVTDPEVGGTVIRRTVPAVVLICLVLGFLRIAGETAGFYDRSFGTATRTLIEIAILLGLLWWTAGAIDRQSRRAQEHENSLRESEKRFVRFMENLPGLAWIKDQEGRYVYVNEPAEKVFAISKDDLYGKTDVEVFPPETAAAFIANDRKALEGKIDTQTVETLKDENGDTRHSIVSKFPIPITENESMVGGIAIDITEQKQIQENQAFLFTISEKIRTAKNAEELLESISNEIGKYLGLHRCLFNEIDLENDIETVHRHYARSGEWVTGIHKISSYSPITSEEMIAGRSIINHDSKTDPRTADLFETVYGPANEHAYIAVPMIRGGKWSASLWCSHDCPRTWTDPEVALIENVAERAWAAVERIRSDEYRAKLAAIIEFSEDAIVSKDLKGVITSWNHGAERLFGYSAVEAIGNPITMLIPMERLDEEPEILARIHRGESVEHYETVRRRKDGTLVDISLTVSPILDPQGQVVGASKIARDITYRKLVAERIKANETQLRLITNAIPALVSYCDVSQRYRFANERYAEWFGIGSDQIVGKRIREVIGARAYAHIKPYIEEVLSGRAVSFDDWVFYKVAGRRFVHISYVPDLDTDGEIKGFFALVSDLTELRRSEELLKSSQERMRMLTESFTDYAIISTDVEGRIESWNPGAASMFGYAENEILGEPSDVLFIPEDVVNAVSIGEMRDARKNGRALSERWYVKKNGKHFFASGVMAPLYVGGSLTGYAKIAFDLTERMLNAEALRRAHDELEMRILERTRELAEANVALTEEINIRKTAEQQEILLLQRLVTTQEDERRRIARDLHDHLGQKMTALRLKIASLKDVANGNSEVGGRVTRLQEIAEGLDSDISFLAWELRPKALEELGLVDATGTFVREWSRHYEIPAEFHSANISNLRLDVNVDIHLYRIAQEALNNIAKHANARNVGVLLEFADDVVVLIVEDDGKGFDPDEERRIRKGGKGLGLAGMRERCSLIGGTLELETAPGRGTTVYVKVPITTPKT